MTVSGADPPAQGERALLRAAPRRGDQLRRPDEVDPTCTNFEDLTPLHPEERLVARDRASVIETRIVDLVDADRQGPAGLIVAPPRTGKTVLLQKMATPSRPTTPKPNVIVLLIDERPEEVTDFRTATPTRRPRWSLHVRRTGEPARAGRGDGHREGRRWSSSAEDVVILLDSITRLARAYNAEIPHSGKICPAVSTPTPCKNPRSSSAPPAPSSGAAR
jgi:transcription termination factor Rho